MSYLNIEPFEVRHELLINARTAIKLLGIKDEGMSGIPVESLEPVKADLKALLSKNNQLLIDSTIYEPDIISIDFVTLSASGVLIRDTPVPESLDEGILGMTLVYETEAYPNTVSLEWNVLDHFIPNIETTSIDPFGTSTKVLTPQDPQFIWENSLFSVPRNQINSIAVEQRAIPYISYLLLLILAIGLIVSHKIKNQYLSKTAAIAVFSLAILCFPFVRFKLNLPFVSELTPSKERIETIIEQLLTNVYKSFDVKNEERVYDRLALSVTGDKLAEIYLDNRKSLELENRGGVRASIDKVRIIAIDNIGRSAKSTFTARTEWLVNGSVGHFGHTHYRRNYYNALITFAIIDNNWKIKDIELIEEKRLL